MRLAYNEFGSKLKLKSKTETGKLEVRSITKIGVEINLNW